MAWQKLFLPTTPRSELAKMIEVIVEDSSWKVKVVERARKSVKQLPSTSDSLSTKGEDPNFKMDVVQQIVKPMQSQIAEEVEDKVVIRLPG